MRFETVIRNGNVVTSTGTCVGTRAMVLSSGLLFSVLAFPNLPASAQKPSDASVPPEMLYKSSAGVSLLREIVPGKHNSDI